MARTMDDLKDGASTWAHEVKQYEMDKRKVLDEGFLRGPQFNLKQSQMKMQERIFDPLLQRYRDNRTDFEQRKAEETERVNHLNRAYDIQILREQPFHILNNTSKLEQIAPGSDPVRQPGKERQKVGKPQGTYPTSQQDFNIISNLPFDVHHWNKPELRPRHIEREGAPRKVPQHLCRDFNIVNNRYREHHDARVRKEKELQCLEGTQKVMAANKFDPITQQFNDPKDEEKAKTCDDAREVELNLRAESLLPPSYTGRPTNFYDVVSNEVSNPEMVKYIEGMEWERKDRYRNRYIVEHNFHAQDMKGDHLTQARRMNKVKPERFLEQDRGYCIVTNKGYGTNPKEQRLYPAFPQKSLTPWEQVMKGRSASTPTLGSVPEGSVAASVAADRQPSAAPSSERKQRSTPAQGRSSPSALAEAGNRTLSASSSQAALRQPPGLTRPVPAAAAIVRSPSAPAVQRHLEVVTDRTRALPAPVSATPAASARPVASASADQTRMAPMPLMGTEAPTMRAPPAPALPGSPVGSIYSRPSAKMV